MQKRKGVGGSAGGGGWTKTFGKRIFHMLHHCLAGGQRESLIKMEITPELKVMRCRHTATFLPSALGGGSGFMLKVFSLEYNHMV